MLNCNVCDIFFLLFFSTRPCVLCKRVLMCSVAMVGSLLPSLPWNLLKWYVNSVKFVFPQIASVWSVVFSEKVKRLNLVVVAAIFRRRNLSSGLTIIQSEFFWGQSVVLAENNVGYVNPFLPPVLVEMAITRVNERQHDYALEMKRAYKRQSACCKLSSFVFV